MELVRGAKFFGYIVVASLCGVTTKRVCLTLQAPRMVRSTFSSTFSPDITQSITKKIEKRGIVTQDLVQELKEMYPVVAAVSSNYHVPGILDVYIEAHQPIVCINNDVVMLADGRLIPRALCAPMAVSLLPQVAVDADQLINGVLPKSFQAFTGNLHKLIIAGYDVTWHEPFAIELRSKRDKNFSVVCSYDHVPAPLLLQYCEQIKRDRKGRDYREWVADVRFDNQILVRSAHRGKNNGQSIFR